jgi:hypothetical protein
MPITNFKLPIFGMLVALSAAMGQESPAPSASSTSTPSPSVARSVRISFVPPPMEGTISLGIFDSDKKLVRVLHREAKVHDFTIDETSLTTSWDGKNDRGEDLPAGKYHARGFMVGDLKIQEISPPAGEPPAQSSDHVSIKLMMNPLLSDVRSVMDIGVGFDGNGSFLRTMDDLPLYTLSKMPNLTKVSIAKETEKTGSIWQTDGTTTQQFRVSNLDKMMGFDCGDFELK